MRYLERVSWGRAEQAVKGICAAAMGTSKEKMENKQKILEFLQKNGKADNSELRELLVSQNGRLLIMWTSWKNRGRCGK